MPKVTVKGKIKKFPYTKKGKKAVKSAEMMNEKDMPMKSMKKKMRKMR